MSAESFPVDDASRDGRHLTPMTASKQTTEQVAYPKFGRRSTSNLEAMNLVGVSKVICQL